MVLISSDETNWKGGEKINKCPNIYLFVGNNPEFSFTKLNYKLIQQFTILLVDMILANSKHTFLRMDLITRACLVENTYI